MTGATKKNDPRSDLGNSIHTPAGKSSEHPELGARLRSIEEALTVLGVDLVSSCSVPKEISCAFHESIRKEAESLGYAIVFGIKLSDGILSTVSSAPNWTYYHHYRAVNFSLDQAALAASALCRKLGANALPIPASQIVDWVRLVGHLSHRELGALAGLGWHGRNNLLVHPVYGSQVRYATVLTDLPLPEKGVEENFSDGCGDCIACVGACPASAIAVAPENFDLDRCTAQLRRFSRSEKLNVLICGICVRVCQGRRRFSAQGSGR